jgi:hypothetical protein
METLLERLRARLSNPEKVIGRPGWKDPVIFPPISPEVLANAEKELGFRLPQLLRTIYLEVANGGIGPSLGLLGLTGGATDDQKDNAVDLYCSYRSWNDSDQNDEEDPDDDDEGTSEPASKWYWPERMLPICYRGCTVYECLDCNLADPPVSVVDLGAHDWNEPFGQTALSLAVWFETWLQETDGPEPTWLKRLDDGQNFKTVRSASFNVYPMRTAQMPYIVKLKNLRDLCLSGCPLSDDSFVHLRELKRLQRLQLHSSPITDKGLVHLAPLVKLTSLDLAESRLTDAGLAHLTHLPLETLNLAFTKITDAGLPHLYVMKTLRDLNLTCVKVSKRGLAALRAALPDCHVRWCRPDKRLM